MFWATPAERCESRCRSCRLPAYLLRSEPPWAAITPRPATSPDRCPLPTGGREKGFRIFIQMGRINADAIVGNLDTLRSLPMSSAFCKPGLPHGSGHRRCASPQCGIHQQVHEHLVDLAEVAIDQGNTAKSFFNFSAMPDFAADPVSACCPGQHRCRVLPCRLVDMGKGLQVDDDALDPLQSLPAISRAGGVNIPR